MKAKIMKNIQIIEPADNCTYSIFSTTAVDFKKIFPEEGQDIEFVEDFIKRLGKRHASAILERLWRTPVEKTDVIGIDGTLFFQLEYKKIFYPTKRDCEMMPGSKPARHGESS
jgi:hypothetical protein